MSKKSKIKVDLNQPILSVKGKPLQPEEENTLSLVLADYLSARRGGNARKQWQWALQLGSDGVLELDRVDFDELKNVVEKEDEMLRNIVKAQVLEVLLNAEKEADASVDNKEQPAQ